MSKEPDRPGWYDDPGSGFAKQAFWDGQKWTGATRGLLRHVKRLLVVVAVLVVLYGLNQLGDTLGTFGWVETSGRVVEERSWYNGFFTERGLIIPHQDGSAFVLETGDDRLAVGDVVTFYFDPGQPVFLEEPRSPNAFEEETNFPRANATLVSPWSHAGRAALALAAAGGLLVLIRSLNRSEWRVADPERR